MGFASMPVDFLASPFPPESEPARAEEEDGDGEGNPELGDAEPAGG